MASTDTDTGLVLPVVGTALANGLYLAAGRETATAATPTTATVVTGLKEVLFFVATQCGTCVDTEACVLQVNEDLPLASGSVRVIGITVDVGAATKTNTAVAFNWIAIGYR